MSRYIVDASVAVKWFLHEPHSESALRLLDDGNELLAPDLLMSESANVFWKRVRAGQVTEKEAAEAITTLLRLPLQFVSSKTLAPPALEIACRTQRSVYDCLYLALAAGLNSCMVTADSKFFAAIQATPLAESILWIESLGK